MFSKKKKIPKCFENFLSYVFKSASKICRKCFSKTFSKKRNDSSKMHVFKKHFCHFKEIVLKKKKTFSLLVLTGTELGFEVEGGKYNFSWAYFLFFF